MKPLEIDTIAKQAGITLRPPLDSLCTTESLIKFAALLIISERERCAVICEQAGIDGYGTLAAAQLIRKQ